MGKKKKEEYKQPNQVRESERKKEGMSHFCSYSRKGDKTRYCTRKARLREKKKKRNHVYKPNLKKVNQIKNKIKLCAYRTGVWWWCLGG